MAEREAAAKAVIDASTDPGGVPVVSVSGELDMSNADLLEARVRSLTAARPARIVFDLGGLRFMDSAGIAVLLRAADSVGTVSLRRPSDTVRRVIELTGLTEVLVIES